MTAVAGTGRPRTLTYAATVTARQADAIARTDEKALVAAPGEKFADAVTVEATYKETAAAGVAVTATMVKDRLGVIDNDKGPYFEDADGKPVRTLTGLTTDDEGSCGSRRSSPTTTRARTCCASPPRAAPRSSSNSRSRPRRRRLRKSRHRAGRPPRSRPRPPTRRSPPRPPSS